MPAFMERRVHIALIDLKRARVTTPLRQTVVDLTELKGHSYRLDLVTLKVVKNNSENCDFYLRIWTGQGTTESPYNLRVYQKKSQNDLEMVDSFDFKGKVDKTFTATVPS